MLRQMHTPPPPPVDNRWQPGAHLPELDGLWGIAVLMVLLLHTKPAWFYWGWSGVDLFLVLSGFLITRILLENRDQSGMLWSFYGRRVLRIWPVYYLTLALTAVMHAMISGARPDATDPGIPVGHWLGLVFLQNTEHYFGLPELPYIWYFRHSWSVAVEEQFYLIWPLLLVGLAIRPSRLLALGMIAIGTAVVARAHDMFIYVLLTRVDGLVLGAIVAFAVAGPRPWLQQLPGRYLVYAAIAGAGLAAPYVWIARDLAEAAGPRPTAVLGFALLFAAALCIVLRNLGQRWLAWLRSRPLRWVGRISYGLYMYHLPVGALAMLASQQGWFGSTGTRLAMWCGSLLVAHLSYELMEKRILAYRRALPYRLSRTPTDPAHAS
jgi:peptidoglycan/LPS O-acetylase OafA/YrhL